MLNFFAKAEDAPEKDCFTCHYFDGPKCECHRLSPNKGGWPCVISSDWCGEWISNKETYDKWLDNVKRELAQDKEKRMGIEEQRSQEAKKSEWKWHWSHA